MYVRATVRNRPALPQHSQAEVYHQVMDAAQKYPATGRDREDDHSQGDWEGGLSEKTPYNIMVNDRTGY
ncbi:MAG: hypothetical protein GDA38_24795 [Hormoscilla sp. SP12CHS1]|nr:hypothetical protein [Hormoscilla sp. SP12CHS1]